MSVLLINKPFFEPVKSPVYLQKARYSNVDIIGLLLYERDQALYAGFPDNYRENQKYVPSLSTIVLLALMEILNLLEPFKKDMIIPESYIIFFLERCRNAKKTENVSSGKIALVEDQITIIQNSVSYVNIWESILDFFNDCERNCITDDERISYMIGPELYPVYFGGVAKTWGDGNRGKAFLNPADAGHAYGRIYKITYGQYLEIKNMEGRDYTGKVELGMIEGIPVITFTSENVQKRNAPCLEYLDTILDGLREVYPGLRESAVSADLISGIFSMDEIRVLNCLREEEHGLSNKEISDITGIETVREKEVISELIGLGLVKQDSRSLQHMVTEDDAVFYTKRTERPVIDRVRMLADEEKVMQGVEPDEPLVTTVSLEGGRRMILSTRYERKPENRQAAIRLHGTVCQVCGFDFREHYGELGEGYIEVHHIRPLSTLDEEVAINPETDLVCLCANCHRMMHRSRNHVMTVDELKGLYREV